MTILSIKNRTKLEVNDVILLGLTMILLGLTMFGVQRSFFAEQIEYKPLPIEPKRENLGGGYYKGSGTRGPVRAGGKREAIHNFLDGKGPVWDVLNILKIVFWIFMAVMAVILLAVVWAFFSLVHQMFFSSPEHLSQGYSDQ